MVGMDSAALVTAPALYLGECGSNFLKGINFVLEIKNMNKIKQQDDTLKYLEVDRDRCM